MGRRSARSYHRIVFVGLMLCSIPAACGNPDLQATHQPAWRGKSDGRSKLTQPDQSLIRVLLNEGVRELAVAITGPYEVRQGETILAQGSNLRKIHVSTVEGTPPRLVLGQLACKEGPIEIIPQLTGTLRVYLKQSSGKTVSHRYHGHLRLTARESGAGAARNSRSVIDVLNVLSLEEYLPGVLAAELYPSWHLETYRVQAIAARTYALYQIQTFGTKNSFDVRATEASQAYKGLDLLTENANARRAARDTQGIVCTWSSPLGEKIFATYYSSACGGMTQDAANCFQTPSIPPLAGGVQCTYCSIGSRVYRWDPVKMSKQTVTELFLARYPQHSALGTIQTIQVLDSTPDGRPLNLRLLGDSGHAVTVKSYAFRLAMGGHRILSNHCKIVDLGQSFEFRDGRGFGHAVGMCQWGAEGQARLGRKAAEILAYYYPSSRLKRAY